MRRWIGLLVVATSLANGGCGGEEEKRGPTGTPAAPVAGAPAAGTSVGVKECDDYLARFEACLPKFPQEQQAALRTNLDAQRNAFRSSASKPEEGAQLAKTCTGLMDMLEKNHPMCE